MDYTIKFKSNEDSLAFLDNILENFLEEFNKGWVIDINTEDNTVTLERESLYYLAVYIMDHGILSIKNIFSIEGLGLWGLNSEIDLIKFFKNCQYYDFHSSSTPKKLIVKYDPDGKYDCNFLRDLDIRSKYKSIFELFTYNLVMLGSIEYSDLLESYFYNYCGICNGGLTTHFSNIRPNIKYKYNEISLPNVMLGDNKFRVFLDILTEIEFTLYDQKGL